MNRFPNFIIEVRDDDPWRRLNHVTLLPLLLTLQSNIAVLLTEDAKSFGISTITGGSVKESNDLGYELVIIND